MSVASNASSVTDDVDEDDDGRPKPKNMLRDARNPVIADASLITSNAAEIGATKGPDVNANRVICGM
jgi:hypothetical protein